MADKDGLTTLTSASSSGSSTPHDLHDLSSSSQEVCVICLDRISEKAVALPCQHDQFDFPCLGTWLHQQQLCPLCKREIKAIRYEVEVLGGKVFHLPAPETPQRTSTAVRHRRLQNRPYGRNARYGYRLDRHTEAARDDCLGFRKQVYRHRLYSLHVGTNRISRYRNITPTSFLKDDHLVSRARMWIRRELAVFDFLNPDSAPFGGVDRRGSNAEFLLEYIIAILKSIDLKGSTGQAEELLKDFLGRDNARLFLHELEAWLRSPYENLKDWDRAVQYPDRQNPCVEAPGPETNDRSRRRPVGQEIHAMIEPG